MNIKIHSSELNRMMKTLSQCINPKDQYRSNVEVIYDNNMLTIRGTDGQLSAVMSAPVLGGDGEVFCVDGSLFAKVCAMCSGDVTISTDGNVCTVKGLGRTRIPIVDAKIPAFEFVKGGVEITVSSHDFSSAYDGIAHAIATDQSRLTLTGVKVESDTGVLSMTSLDGFRMAHEERKSDGIVNGIDAIIPGNFMKLLRNSISAGESLTLTVGKNRVTAKTDGMMIGCALLTGTYPDVKTILPADFSTDVLLKADYLRSAMKSNSIVCASNNLVKLVIDDEKVVVTGNSEQAEYDAEIMCEKHGKNLTIAFNQKYILDTINSIPDEEIILRFNAPNKPCVITTKRSAGYRLVLPVRVVG